MRSSRRRLGVWAAVCALALAGCTSVHEPRSPTIESSVKVARSTPSSDPTTSSIPARAKTTTVPVQPRGPIDARTRQLTRGGLWWAVDSVVPISAASLANVRGWYRGAPTPLLWGRYVNGVFGLRPGELAFARAHHIGVYFIVPDGNCSICAGGGDLCGNDHTTAQGREDARRSVQDAISMHIPARVTLFKDIEQVGACYGELSADYLLAWYRYVGQTRYRPGLYGNTHEQGYDFPRAYCAAARAEPAFAHIPLAQDEPEPQIGAPQGTIGPRNAPPFRPNVPWCVPIARVKIWQYGESGSTANYTDADEIVPGTPGLIAPDGSIT